MTPQDINTEVLWLSLAHMYHAEGDEYRTWAALFLWGFSRLREIE